MRRTTTFRFSRVVALLAFGVSLPALGAAQDSTVASTGRTHIVQRGETLWDLAERYYSDPFLWPEIYRMNTVVVEDPHWIFPGEELRLDPVSGVAGVPRPGEAPRRRAMPPAAPAPPSSDLARTVFSRPRQDEGFGLSRTRSAPYRYQALRKGQFYSAGYLTEQETLPWARVSGAVGKPTLKNLTASSGARIHDEIELEIPSGATYAVGDSLLVARLSREVPDWGRLVVPTGLARVSAVGSRRIRARIVSQFDRVADGQVALPAEPFPAPGDVVPVPVDNGVRGQIVVTRHVSQVGQQLGVVYLDLGRSQGVALGDVFEVLRHRDADGEFGEIETESVGVVQIVHVRDRSATGIVTGVFDLGIAVGSPVRLIRKMPS